MAPEAIEQDPMLFEMLMDVVWEGELSMVLFGNIRVSREFSLPDPEDRKSLFRFIDTWATEYGARRYSVARPLPVPEHMPGEQPVMPGQPPDDLGFLAGQVFHNLAFSVYNCRDPQPMGPAASVLAARPGLGLLNPSEGGFVGWQNTTIWYPTWRVAEALRLVVRLGREMLSSSKGQRDGDIRRYVVRILNMRCPVCWEWN